MTLIKKEHFIESLRRAFQFISYCHSPDFIKSMTEAYQQEKNPSAKSAIGQILVSSRMSAEKKRPICQDTGICVVFLNIGMDVRWETDLSIQEMVDEGVRQAYCDAANKLRFSILRDPAGTRTNTQDNTPAVVHYTLVPGDEIEVHVAAKGGGSENKSQFAVLCPSDSIADWVLDVLPRMGAGWCPPGILGIGIGGTPEYALYLAKKALLSPIDIHTLLKKKPETPIEKLRLEIYERANQSGIGAQGLGGVTTVLDVKIEDYPTHAASLPVGLIPNCAATRHIHFTLDGTGCADFPEPDLSLWPDIPLFDDKTSALPVNLETLTKEDVQQWTPGQELLLSGTLFTARDAAHQKIRQLLNEGKKLPFDLRGKIIYYVGPVDPVGEEVIGPAGPTTADRMDKFTEMMLSDQVGILGMIGKSERKQKAIDAIKKHKSVSMIAVGGAAYLISKSVTAIETVAFPELGMEAIRKMQVKNMPVTVSVSSSGESIHIIGPQKWHISLKKTS